MACCLCEGFLFVKDYDNPGLPKRQEMNLKRNAFFFSVERSITPKGQGFPMHGAFATLTNIPITCYEKTLAISEVRLI
jgi:hypothetical protein